MVAPKAGELVRASNYPKVRVIKKTANESVTSSTTLQDDDDFSVTLDAGRTYLIEAYVSVSGATAGDVKIAWAVTGGVAGLTTRSCVGPQVGTTDASLTSMRAYRSSLSTAVAYGVDGTLSSAVVEAFLVETTTAGTSGTLTMQWAQNASSATATIVGSASFMVITDVDEI